MKFGFISPLRLRCARFVLRLLEFAARSFTPLQAYTSELAKIPEKSLEDADAQVVVVGCGQWNLIKNYARTQLRNNMHFR